jgi:hypothetical protein
MPLATRVIFLLAVFCTFAGIGIATDVANAGRDPLPTFLVVVVLSGLFSVVYAFVGVVLRGKFFKGILPIIVVHILALNLVGRWMPGPPAGAAEKAAGDSGRLRLDGIAIIVSVALGYAGLVRVSISEARRYAGTQTEKVRLEGEMAAAREAQRLMVPEVLPPVPGYAIESVYRPATEVGGDFFQVVALNSGRSLAVIGDVSGKGLHAAMIVSMIVGMLSIISGRTEEPGEILADLNRRLHGRMHGGFATCLAIRLDSEGKLALATAGHPAPYLNGREIPLSGSMPLGMSDSESFAQTIVDMQHGDRVILLTDGILEARDADGEIFGFPRVESLLREGVSARALADAAQQYGQEDDITVIGIARQA